MTAPPPSMKTSGDLGAQRQRKPRMLRERPQVMANWTADIAASSEARDTAIMSCR